MTFNTRVSNTGAFVPGYSGAYVLGSPTLYWNSVYAGTFRYKTAPYAFDEYDDIQIIKNSKTLRVDGRLGIDIDSLGGLVAPDEGEAQQFVDMGAFTGLHFGAVKQVILQRDDDNECN